MFSSHWNFVNSTDLIAVVYKLNDKSNLIIES